MSLIQSRLPASPFEDEIVAEGAPAPFQAPAIDQVVSLMPGFVYVYDHTTQSNVYTNRSVGDYLGYTQQEMRDLGDSILIEIIHPDDVATVAAHMERVGTLADGNTMAIEYRVLTKAGEERWLRSVDTVFARRPDGTVLRHIGCASDITTEKRAELHLEELNAELERKVEERTQALADLNADLESRIRKSTSELRAALVELEGITYTATHDLKVPVNNLCRLGLMLRENAHSMTEEQAEQVEWVNSCAQQLNRKIAALFQVSHIGKSGEAAAEQVDLEAAVQRILEQRAPALEAIKAELNVAIPKGAAVTLCPLELTTLIEAMLDNALSYADPKRQLQIDLRYAMDEDGPTLSVADNGTGLTLPADLPKVFGLFQRAHKSPPGDGLALHCAQRRLQRYGGRITVVGEKGQGVEFKVHFPKKGKQ